jgi:hypothetical protein
MHIMLMKSINIQVMPFRNESIVKDEWAKVIDPYCAVVCKAFRPTKDHDMNFLHQIKIV